MWILNESWWVGVCYCFEYVCCFFDICDDDIINCMDVWVGYKWNNFDWIIEGIYKKVDKYDFYDGGKDNYEYNFRIVYIID